MKRFTVVMLALLLVAGCHRRRSHHWVDTSDSDSDSDSGPDVTRPTVSSTNPIAGDPDVEVNTKVVAYFSEAMVPSTINSTTLSVTGPGTSPVSGIVSYDVTNHAAIFVPSVPFAFLTDFTVTITTGVQDLAGNSMAMVYVWTFDTGMTTDTTRPTVTSTIPADGATNVPVTTKVTALFSEQMDSLTITAATFTFTLQQGTTSITGSVVCPSPGTSATFIPEDRLEDDTVYTATVTTGVKDLAGNALLMNFVWSFTTGSVAITNQEPVDLQSADGFAVLAGTTVTNTGPTVINGNVGLSPGSAIVGFPPGFVNGTTFGPGPTADQAKLDLTAAYLDLAGRSVDPISCPGNLGGLTLAPGLYKNASAVVLSGTGSLGILTLDAQGDSNAVWVFQIGSSFTTDPGTSVVLSGGALVKNVYWQISSSAILDTTCKFKGNILAEASISLKTGATLDGRALTQSGAVTLESNTVTKP